MSSAGVTPGGLADPTELTALVGPGWEQSAGGCVSSVLVEFGTKDYVYDDYGNEKPMTDTGQRMYMCMRTTRGSRISFQSSGLETPTHIIESRIQREVERLVRSACKPVTGDGSATIDSVEVESENNMVVAVIRWTDNRRQTQETTRAQLAQ